MEDKSFELLTQIYKEVSELRKEDSNRFDKLEIAIENEIKPGIKIALEGYQVVSEKLTTLEDKVDKLTTKVENQDVQITVLKGGKPKQSRA